MLQHEANRLSSVGVSVDVFVQNLRLLMQGIERGGKKPLESAVNFRTVSNAGFRDNLTTRPLAWVSGSFVRSVLRSCMKSRYTKGTVCWRSTGDDKSSKLSVLLGVLNSQKGKA